MFHRVPIFAEYHKKRSAKALPSAGWLVLGEILFAGRLYAECPLPSATLGKGFAEFFFGLRRVFTALSKAVDFSSDGGKERGGSKTLMHAFLKTGLLNLG